MFSRSGAGYAKFDTESEHGEGALPAIQFLGVARTNDSLPILLATYSHHSKTDLGDLSISFSHIISDRFITPLLLSIGSKSLKQS
jgi:hypothetical protein